MPNRFEVLAIRYGTWQSTRSHCFYRYDTYGEPDADVSMDFFLWVIRDDEHTVVVDTGFHPDALRTRPDRLLLAQPPDALAAVGVDPESVADVVVTHLHWDHIGNLPAFPNARLHLQRRELEFWTGPHGGRPPLARAVEPAEIEYVRQAVDRGSVELVDGTAEIVPGVSVRLVGGHTPGQQIVVVANDRPVVLASDSVHYYEEVEHDRAYELFTDVIEMYDTYALLRRLRAERDAIIVAGHDPDVMRRFPVADNENTVRVGP